MRHAAIVPSCTLMAGTAAAQVLGDVARPWLAGLLVCGLVLVAAAWRLHRPGLLVTSVGLVFTAGGLALGQAAWHAAWQTPLRRAWDAQVAAQQERGPANGRPDGAAPAVLTGVLRSDAAVRADGVSLSLAVRTIRFEPAGEDGQATVDHEGPGLYAPGGVVLSVGGAVAAGRVQEWRAGRTVRLPARLRRPSRHLNPGVFDEERALARRGTSLVGSVKSGLLVEVVSQGGWWAEMAARLRAQVRRVVARHVGRADVPAAGLVTAILIGDRAGLDQEVARSLQEAGTYHVVAISGGNIAVLAAVTLSLFRVAGALGRSAMLLAVVLFLAFGSVVQGGASVDRAVTMAVLSFLARAADHRVEARHALAVAAAFLVVADPLVVSDAGFLLSFAATGGIVLAAPLVDRRRRPRWLVFAAALLVASLAAELATLPVAAYLFGRVTVAGLALNFVAVPLMGLTQLLGIAVLLCAPLSESAADVVGWLGAMAARGLIASAGLVEVAPAVAWRVARPSGLAVAVYYVGAAAAIWAWRARPRSRTHVARPHSIARAAVGGAAAALLWMTVQPWAWWSARGDGRLHVTFIDVGQGDAALVRFPRGRAMLVDAGGSTLRAYDVGDRLVGPVIRTLGVLDLDTVVLTHADVDHAGGLETILREFRPFEVWEGIAVPGLPLLGRLRDAAATAGVRWSNVHQGHRSVIDGVVVTVHHPDLADWDRPSVRNDDSIVLELTWGEVSVVLAGDIGGGAEASVTPRLADGAVRVLKVPHHGSLTSSTPAFLSALDPCVAVFSVGRGNRFGHPAPAVLERYRQQGIAMFRTDLDGAVTVTTDGSRLEVRGFTGRTFSRAASRPPTRLPSAPGSARRASVPDGQSALPSP
jgi:competence protein ComEC